MEESVFNWWKHADKWRLMLGDKQHSWKKGYSSALKKLKRLDKVIINFTHNFISRLSFSIQINTFKATWQNYT